jgi:hypothetical protein
MGIRLSVFFEDSIVKIGSKPLRCPTREKLTWIRTEPQNVWSLCSYPESDAFSNYLDILVILMATLPNCTDD